MIGSYYFTSCFLHLSPLSSLLFTLVLVLVYKSCGLLQLNIYTFWITLPTTCISPLKVTMGHFEDEDRKFAEEVQAVKNWWKDSRWRYTKRPFTAEQIVAKRGNLTIDYPSAVQAKKLWNTLENNFKVWALGAV